MSDLISRQTAIDAFERFIHELGIKDEPYNYGEMALSAQNVPSVENKGEWIYDKSIYNWRCSECGETPPPTGYVGKAEFMATYFKFCNYCGADMRGET